MVLRNLMRELNEPSRTPCSAFLCAQSCKGALFPSVKTRPLSSFKTFATEIDQR